MKRRRTGGVFISVRFFRIRLQAPCGSGFPAAPIEAERLSQKTNRRVDNVTPTSWPPNLRVRRMPAEKAWIDLADHGNHRITIGKREK
jgi:hypothetical protein